MYNTNDENEKDEGLNLSDMINEYEEDDVLRNKIEALKAEKALEEAQVLAEQEKPQEEAKSSDRSALSHTMELPRYGGESVFDGTFLDEDNEQANGEELDVDKTLVIMDNHIERDVDDNESILLYGDHEVDAEEITEEDIQEFLGEDDVKKQRKPMDPKKMNKIITYVISGVVAICVLVGGGFGIKMAMDSFSSDEPSEPSEPEKKPPVEKEPTEKPEEEIKPPVTKEPTPSQSGDNSNAIRIAEINGTIKAKQQQVTDLTSAVENAKAEVERLKKEAEELSGKHAAKNAEYDNISNKLTEAKNAVSKAEADVAAGIEGAQAALDAANVNLNGITSALTGAQLERDNAKTAWENKEAEKSKKISDKDGYVSQISTIQLDIANLQKELQTLQ